MKRSVYCFPLDKQCGAAASGAALGRDSVAPGVGSAAGGVGRGAAGCERSWGGCTRGTTCQRVLTRVKILSFPPSTRSYYLRCPFVSISHRRPSVPTPLLSFLSVLFFIFRFLFHSGPVSPLQHCLSPFVPCYLVLLVYMMELLEGISRAIWQAASHYRVDG